MSSNLEGGVNGDRPHRPEEAPPSKDLVLSPHVATFAHLGAVYVYHDLYGYLMEMSPDILAFLREFREPVDPAVVCAKHANSFGEQAPEGFVGVFLQFRCLVTPGTDELAGIWSMVAVPGRWNVWERDATGALTFYTAWGDREVARHRIDPAKAAIWDRFDGETTLERIAADVGPKPVADLVRQLVHHDVQALKLSAVPLSFYKGRMHLKAPYLTSTMPYASYDPDVDPLPVAPDLGLYHRESIEDPDLQFDVAETTLSHLLRRAHPALDGRTYGEALLDGLEAKGLLPAGPLRVLEVGAGLGELARSAIAALQARGREVSWDVLELSPALGRRQREALAGLPAAVHEGDVLLTAWPREAYDLVVSNEMVGDLPAAHLTRAEAGLEDETLSGDALQDHLRSLGPAGELAARYTLPLGDAPDEFWLQTGAIRFLERVAEHLAPGGTAVVTEFGELSKWPVVSTHLDHPELSTHFGLLTLVAKALGLEADFEYVMDLVGLDRTAEGLATTRSQLRALQALFADHGLDLPKIGWTLPMLSEHAAKADDLDLARIGDLRFEPIEDRLMGLVPHEFKALLLRKPAA